MVLSYEQKVRFSRDRHIVQVALSGDFCLGHILVFVMELRLFFNMLCLMNFPLAGGYFRQEGYLEEQSTCVQSLKCNFGGYILCYYIHDANIILFLGYGGFERFQFDMDVVLAEELGEMVEPFDIAIFYEGFVGCQEWVRDTIDVVLPLE